MFRAGLIQRIASACRRAAGAARAMAAPALTAALALAGSVPAAAQTVVIASETAPTVRLHVPAGKSAPLPVDPQVSSVVVAQPDTAKVGQAGPHELYVMGRDVGATNILVYGPGAQLLQQVEVDVGYDAPQIAADIAAALPRERITVTDLSQAVLLTGHVSSTEAAETARAIAERSAPEAVISHLDVHPSQVLLEVRLVETSSIRLREISAQLAASDHAHLAGRIGSGFLGTETPFTQIDAPGGAGRFDLDARLQALEQKGEARILAQPSLVALTGEPASFRAGGELPYPVPQSRDRLAIEFRPYGTAVAFQPEVQANGMIRVFLKAEVSGLDTANSIRIGGVRVPGLITRRVTTAADLRDGQTLMFAGLSEDNRDLAAQGAPLVSRIPVVGPMLTSWRARHSRRELAVFVTPRLLDGAATPADVGVPQLAQAPPTAPAAEPPHRSPADRALADARRVTHKALELPRRGWSAVRTWTGRLWAAATAPPPQTVVAAR
jgi:pilus assembly protein CpaC